MQRVRKSFALFVAAVAAVLAGVAVVALDHGATPPAPAVADGITPYDDVWCC